MMRILQTLLQQSYGLVIVICHQGFLRQFQTRELILSAHLAFATFPWVKLVGIKLLHCLLILTCLVQEGDFLQ